RPRGAKFNVTAKDETVAQDYISPIHWPLTILWGAMLAGLLAFALRWIAFPGGRSVLSVVGGWATLHFIVVSIAWRSVSEKQQRRAAPRVAIRVPTTLWLGPAPEDELLVEIVNASTSGVRLKIPRGLGHGTTVAQLQDRNIYFYPHLADSP